MGVHGTQSYGLFRYWQAAQRPYFPFLHQLPSPQIRSARNVARAIADVGLVAERAQSRFTISVAFWSATLMLGQM